LRVAVSSVLPRAIELEGLRFFRVIGHRLKIVPQADPFSLKAGEKLPVLVLFDGKPLAGEEVEAGDETVLMWPDLEKPKTNAKGMAMMP